MKKQLPLLVPLLGKTVPDQMVKGLSHLRLVADISQALQHLPAGQRTDQFTVAVHDRQEVDPLPHHNLRGRSQRGLQDCRNRVADHRLFNTLPFAQLLHIAPAHDPDDPVPLIRYRKTLLPAGL
ncbi:hypothetical protein D3C81_1692400 [compost metagenome]